MRQSLPFFGPRVWHHSKPLLAFTTAILGGYLAVMTLAEDPSSELWEIALFGLAGIAAWWMVAIRPRTVLLDDSVAVVAWLRTRHIDLSEIVNGRSGFDGARLQLRNGKSINCGTLQTPNYLRWLGRTSRSDRAVTQILVAAAGARGDEPPYPPGVHRC